MALIPLYEAKTYLRVDSSDEDALIGVLLSSGLPVAQLLRDFCRCRTDLLQVNAPVALHAGRRSRNTD